MEQHYDQLFDFSDNTAPQSMKVPYLLNLSLSSFSDISGCRFPTYSRLLPSAILILKIH